MEFIEVEGLGLGFTLSQLGLRQARSIGFGLVGFRRSLSDNPEFAWGYGVFRAELGSQGLGFVGAEGLGFQVWCFEG